VHQINEFNIKNHKIFLQGACPQPPRGTEVHSPQISQNPVGKTSIAIPMQLKACFRIQHCVV